MGVVTSALSLARELYRYGEPNLADRSLALSPDQVATIGSRMGEMHLHGDARRIWPDGPKTVSIYSQSSNTWRAQRDPPRALAGCRSAAFRRPFGLRRMHRCVQRCRLLRRWLAVCRQRT